MCVCLLISRSKQLSVSLRACVCVHTCGETVCVCDSLSHPLLTVHYRDHALHGLSLSLSLSIVLSISLSPPFCYPSPSLFSSLCHSDPSFSVYHSKSLLPSFFLVSHSSLPLLPSLPIAPLARYSGIAQPHPLYDVGLKRQTESRCQWL